MKLPLWVKGRDGKWHRFPYEALITLDNGKLGIKAVFGIIDLGIIDLCEATGWDAGQWFDYNISLDAYVLKEKVGK